MEIDNVLLNEHMEHAMKLDNLRMRMMIAKNVMNGMTRAQKVRILVRVICFTAKLKLTKALVKRAPGGRIMWRTTTRQRVGIIIVRQSGHLIDVVADVVGVGVTEVLVIVVVEVVVVLVVIVVIVVIVELLLPTTTTTTATTTTSTTPGT